MHQCTFLREEQGAQGQHAVVLEMRPDPSPPQLLLVVLWCIEVEDAAAGAADARQLCARRARGYVEPEILVLGGGHPTQLADAVERQPAGREGGIDVGQGAEGFPDAQQLLAGVGREAGVQGDPVGEGADPFADPSLEVIEIGGQPGELGHGGVGMGGQLTQLALHLDRARTPLSDASRGRLAGRNCCCHKDFSIPNICSFSHGSNAQTEDNVPTTTRLAIAPGWGPTRRAWPLPTVSGKMPVTDPGPLARGAH